ncbi:MAG: tetratricopeptide repeat protein [Methylacidiphilales bacterium]|nr:tetratricopeptide repeat protein [Candidatus Methylacidiphilales bacterium]MDW8348665.1 tetratricopeptide repeat protein [Verrucomicrobiae bacterium]
MRNRLVATLLLTLLNFTLHYTTPPQTQAAPPSPQDKYLQLYLRLQEAEKLEREEQKASARKVYMEVLSLLQALKEAYPTWEEGIVKYRIRYCQDKIRLLQDATDRTPPPTPPPTSEIIIESTPQAPPKIDPQPPPSTEPTRPSSRIHALEEELAFTKQRLAQAQNEINLLRTRLQATEKQLVMSRSSDLDEKLASILQENSQLKNQLNEAERQLKALTSNSSPSTSSPTKPTSTALANLQAQLRKVQEKLALAEQENNAFRRTTAELKNQLEAAQNNLIAAQKAQLSQRDNESFQRENEVLRDIITRQIQEQARRDAAKKIATEEIENLKIQSAVLRQQLEILASPILNLTPEQLALLRLPSNLQISEERRPPPHPQADNKNSLTTSSSQEPTTPIDPAIEYRSKARIPEDVRGLAREASDAFAEARYDDAIKAYQQIIQKYPESLYAWSNLGVAQFQKQDYDQAETALKQAIRLNPADAFSYSMLGIVYYQKGQYDLAIEHLTRATALEPNDARTRNYLGIACSQKGWQEAAEKECRRAIEIDPNYGDAHFNLAVIYATQRPPAKELARRHYKIALDLGVPKDDKLEKLIQ